jgi:ankyrin repeat protein
MASVDLERPTLRVEVRACLNTLFLTDPYVDREKIITEKGTRVSGTCEWIRRDGTYQSWLNGSEPLLWISGGPGKGKTMLSIYLTEELEKIVRNTKSTGLLFYFCSHQDEKRNTAITILRGLVYQIVEKRQKLVEHILPYFESPEKVSAALSSLETLWVMFMKLLQDPELDTTFCVLDGLDECDENTKGVLVPRIVNMFSQGNLSPSTKAFRLVIVSRDISGLHTCARLRLDPDNGVQVANDVELFISAKVKELSRIDGFTEGLGTTMQELLKKRSEGSFLWVGFVIKELSQKGTCTEVLEALRGLPKGLPAIYNRMLLKIERTQRCTSSRIFRWVAMAFRPLTLEELGAATSIRSPSHLITTEQAVRDKVALCGDFLEVREQRVTLIHPSARDYLLGKESENSPDFDEFRIEEEKTHLELARICFNCVTHSGLRYAPLSLDDRSCSQESPLLEYAALHWPEHTRHCSTLADELFDLSQPFFQEKSDLRKNWWATYHSNKPGLTPSTSPLLHTACCLGIIPWVAAILRKMSFMDRLRGRVDKKDENGLTALHWAAAQGHEAVVQRLIDHGADVNIKDNKDRQTALHSAALRGHKAVVQRLIDHGADVNIKDDKYGWTALHWAAAQGHEAVVQRLIDHRADINIKDNEDGRTALYLAAFQGHEAVVQRLIDYRADVSIKENKYRWTALHWAAAQGYKVVV